MEIAYNAQLAMSLTIMVFAVWSISTAGNSILKLASARIAILDIQSHPMAAALSLPHPPAIMVVHNGIRKNVLSAQLDISLALIIFARLSVITAEIGIAIMDNAPAATMAMM